MPEYEYRIAGLHLPNQWFRAGEWRSVFQAKVQVLCSIEQGGLDLTLGEIVIREIKDD